MITRLRIPAHVEETSVTETPPVQNNSDEEEENDTPNSPTESVSSSTETESVFGGETVVGECLIDTVQVAKMETDMHDAQDHDDSVIREGEWDGADPNGNHDAISPNAEACRQQPQQPSPTSPDNTPLSPTQSRQLGRADLNLTVAAKRNNGQGSRRQPITFNSEVSGNMIDIPPVGKERDPRTGLYRGSVKRRAAIIDQTGEMCLRKGN